MCNVTLVMPFRDSAEYAAAAIGRVETLHHPWASLRVVCVEGDSRDSTRQMLQAWAALDSRVSLVICDTGKPRYGSVVNAERFATLAQVFNAGLDAIDLEWSTHVLMLPCDIEYEPDLLERLLAYDVDLVSPFVWQNGVFYDSWAFSHGGRQFVNFPRSLHQEGPLLEMDTIGGTLLVSAAVLRAGCRYSPVDVDRGLCRSARERGFRVWADPSLSVFHPC